MLMDVEVLVGLVDDPARDLGNPGAGVIVSEAISDTDTFNQCFAD